MTPASSIATQNVARNTITGKAIIGINNVKFFREVARQ
jgi:hypothetical protein